MSKAILWDFDGTLAHRPGRWGALLFETLECHEPGHGATREALRPHLRNGFPWHLPETPHPELSAPGAWWAHVEQHLARAYAAVGIAAARAAELAGLARERYIDPAIGWQLYDDAIPALEQLRTLGWRHVILSNHVPELDAIVAALGVSDLVDAVVNSAHTGFEKPHPEAFAAGRRAAGEVEELWMIGDNPVADFAGAEAVGISAILVRGVSRPCVHWALTLRDVERIVESPGRVARP
jgi:putative hydrolase of the HAD superfamily